MLFQEKDAAVRAALAAGKIQMNYFRQNPKTEIKEDGSPVTIADQLSEKKILEILKYEFPLHGFLAEESGETNSSAENVWIIDPLDGTKDFVRGLPWFGPLIALQKKGEIVVGVIHLPYVNETIWAIKGKGVFIGNKKLQVSKVSSLSQATIAQGNLSSFTKRNYLNFLSDLSLKSFHMRTADNGYGYSYLAQGFLDGLMEAAVKPWDIAAGKIIIEEAGGKVTDFNGVNSIYSGNIIAGNKNIHAELLSLVKQ
ncbi:MAG: inositol monophosphatase [Candidatus Diapherotrites archaeon]|nr:inositol monophosphatase [Candidatus Diapherotrites archaeon]